MLGNLVLSLVIGAASGVGTYMAYGTKRLRDQVGARRVQASITVGVAVAVVGFVLRYAGLI
jgi:uncharacterized protein HemY